MPKSAKGQPEVGATTPHAETRDTPNRNMPSPRAASAVPAPSRRAGRPGERSAGSSAVLAKTSTKYRPSTPKVIRKPAPSMSAPSASGDSVEMAAAPAMAPNAMARRRPLNRPGTNPSTAGVTRLAPNPMMSRPPQVNASMSGASAAHASPATASTRPMRSVLRHPNATPSMPPAIMKAPATSAYTVFATWMSPSDAPSCDDNCATAMFMAALSLVVPTWARISAISGAYEKAPSEPVRAERDWERDSMENPFGRDADDAANPVSPRIVGRGRKRLPRDNCRNSGNLARLPEALCRSNGRRASRARSWRAGACSRMGGMRLHIRRIKSGGWR